MKSFFSPRYAAVAAAIAAMVFGHWVEVAPGANGLNRAKGKYDGFIKIKVPSSLDGGVTKVNAKLWLPAGKGKVSIKANRFPAIKGKVTDYKVSQKEKGRISSSVTGSAAITDKFRSVVKLISDQASVRAKADLNFSGVANPAIFKGDK